MNITSIMNKCLSKQLLRTTYPLSIDLVVHLLASGELMSFQQLSKDGDNFFFLKNSQES